MLGKNSFILNGEEESIKFADSIASNLSKSTILAFRGDLGSGKTFLCRQIIKFLCGSDVIVTSPTFNLLQIYNSLKFNQQDDVYHFDLYRLKYLEESYEIGLQEALNDKICLIEWPEIVEPLLPANTKYIDISIIGKNKRKVTM